MRLFLRITGIILVVFGVGLLVASVAINVIQYEAKEDALESFYYSEDITDDGLVTVSLDEEDNNKKPTSFGSNDILYVVRIPKIDSKEPVKEGTNKSALAESLGHETEQRLPEKSATASSQDTAITTLANTSTDLMKWKSVTRSL